MRRLALLAFVICLAAAFAGLAAGPAAAKDFSITTVNIDATVRPNGDLRVHETRVLDFDGDFSFVYWDLSTKGSSGVEVTAAGGPGARRYRDHRVRAHAGLMGQDPGDLLRVRR